MEDMLQQIHRTYGSLETPNFSFVSRAIEEDRYRPLIQKLQPSFAVEEDTDPNDDVSFGYLLTHGDTQWLLRLSMVGPFAVLMRLAPSGEVAVISPTDRSLSGSEAQLVDSVVDAGLQLLDRAALEQPVPINLFTTSREDARLYQALFTDTDLLPWAI